MIISFLIFVVLSFLSGTKFGYYLGKEKKPLPPFHCIGQVDDDEWKEQK